MELTYTPGETSLKKTYKHFTIAPGSLAQTPESKKLEFFYIGRKTSNIDQLIHSFESGYAAENAENARFILNRLFTQEQTVPDVIIIEGSLGLEAVASLHALLSNKKLLLFTPLILDASNMTREEIVKFRQWSYIDEIINLQQYSKDELCAKITFLRKIKQHGSGSKIGVEVSRPRIGNFHSVTKRVFDVVLSTALLLVLSPILLIIALAIKIESRGPVFYVAKRAGKGYKIFNFYKFRTMFTGADQAREEFLHLNQYRGVSSTGPVFFKINNDPRITKVGSFLRRASLDEVPQLVNVLKGDMSLVGNRPLPLYEAESLTTDEWAKRFMAPAGITGLWQIKKRGQESMSVEERILLDIDYANKSNFIYDLWIMANTPSALIQKTNA